MDYAKYLFIYWYSVEGFADESIFRAKEALQEHFTYYDD